MFDEILKKANNGGIAAFITKENDETCVVNVGTKTTQNTDTSDEWEDAIRSVTTGKVKLNTYNSSEELDSKIKSIRPA